MTRILLAFGFLVFSAWAAAATGTLAANGDTTAVAFRYPHVHLSGTFGGGTVTCYFSDDGGSWRAIAGATFTTADDVTFEFERETQVKCTLSGSTSPSLVWVIM